MRFVDLGRRGVRGMDAADSQLYLVAGPEDDTVTPHVLFGVDAEDLAGPLLHVAARRVRELLPATEGLAVQGDSFALVTDGDDGNGDDCTAPSHFGSAQLSPSVHP